MSNLNISNNLTVLGDLSVGGGGRLMEKLSTP